MKKLVITLFMICLMAATTLALNYTGEVPADGSTVTGDAGTTFSVTVDETCLTANMYFVSPFATYPMTCVDMTASVSVDLSLIADNDDYSWYPIINSFVGPTYAFRVERPPAQVQGLAVGSVSESELDLTWNPGEFDTDFYTVSHTIVSGGPYDFLATVSAPDTVYTHTGLSTGETHYYVVNATDSSGLTGLQSVEGSAIVEDTTSPEVISITQPSGEPYNTLEPTVTIVYDELVDLQVWTGELLIETIPDCQTCAWNYSFESDGTYVYTFKASDAALNPAEDQLYNLIIDATPITETLSIADTIHLIGGDYPDVIKRTALSTSPNDYWLMSFDLRMYGGTSVKAKLEDMVGLSHIIAVDADSAPIIFCENNYDAGTRDIINPLSPDIYYVQNAYNDLAPALSCDDTDPSGEYAFKAYMKIPVPSGLNSDDFLLAFEFGLIPTP